jgi:hypothetical protein
MSDSCSSETVDAKYVGFFENIIFYILSKVSRKNLDPSKKWKGESSGLDSLIQENAKRISRLVDDKDTIEKVQIYEDLHMKRESRTRMEEALYLRIGDEIFEEFLGHFLYAFERNGQDYIGFKKKFMPTIICFYPENNVLQKKYIEFVKYVIFYNITSLISESAPRSRLYGGLSDLNEMIIWFATQIREYMQKDNVRNLFEKFIVLRDNIETPKDDEFDDYLQYEIFWKIFSTFDRMFSSQDITDECIEHFIPIVLSLYKGSEIKSSSKQ